MTEILQNLRLQISEDTQKNIVTVARHKVLSGVLRLFKKGDFQAIVKLSVHFVGEVGIDTGGLMSEVLRLAVKEIMESAVFCGSEYSRSLTPNIACEYIAQCTL